MQATKFQASVGLIAMGALAACTAIAEPTTAEAVALKTTVREVHRFDSVPVMVATADAVVIATVIDSRQGRSVGDPEGPVTFTELTLQIDETLYGEPSDKVLVEVDSPGAWAGVGEQSVLFLHQKEDATDQTYYRPLNSQSVYVVDADGELRASSADEFASETAALGLDQLRTAIADAVTLVDAGQVQAQQTLPKSTGD